MKQLFSQLTEVFAQLAEVLTQAVQTPDGEQVLTRVNTCQNLVLTQVCEQCLNVESYALGTTRRQGTRGRRAIRISTTGPLAPSLGDHVVNHVIVVGRVTGPLAPSRRARPSGDRVRATRAAGRREVGVVVGRWLHVVVGIVARPACLKAGDFSSS